MGAVSSSKVRVAIVGVGNCASSLVQGLEYYKDAGDDARVPGLMHVRCGDYHVSDVEGVAAFDVYGKTLERTRRQSKKISKTQAVPSQIPHEMAKADVHIGPSDHVPWLDDRKFAY